VSGSLRSLLCTARWAARLCSGQWLRHSGRALLSASERWLQNDAQPHPTQSKVWSTRCVHPAVTPTYSQGGGEGGGVQSYVQTRTAHARRMEMEQLMQTVPGLRPPRKLVEPDPVQSLRVCRTPLPAPSPHPWTCSADATTNGSPSGLQRCKRNPFMWVEHVGAE
jgi:hypothetical protein